MLAQVEMTAIQHQKLSHSIIEIFVRLNQIRNVDCNTVQLLFIFRQLKLFVLLYSSKK